MGPQDTPEVVEDTRQPQEPPDPPDPPDLSPRSVNLDESSLRGSPLITVNSVIPLEFEEPDPVYLTTSDHATFFPHYSRCAKPLWPKTPATIPSSFFRDFNRKVVQFNLSEMVKPAPIARRPYDCLDNPYPSGCSRLCNHPVSKELKKEYKEVIKKTKETNASSAKTILLPDEEMIVRDELSRLQNNASPASSEGSSLARPDSLHGDDDEDRIPDELLLKYTKADDEDDYPVEQGAKDSPQHTPRSALSDSGRRCKTPDQLPPDDPDETTAKKKIVLDLRRTKSTENMQTKEMSEANETDLESMAKNDPLLGSGDNLSKEEQSLSKVDKEMPAEPANKATEVVTTPPLTKTSKVTIKTEPKVSVPAPLPTTQPPPPPIPQPKKSKKKFARHKIRSESPDNLVIDLEDPAETQVATSESKVRERKASQSGGEKSKESKSQKGDVKTSINEEAQPAELEMDYNDDEEDDYSEGQLSYRSHIPISKDTPLERRALMSLEKQLELELPESKLDIKRLQEIDDNLINIVRNSSGRNPTQVELEIRELEKELKLPSKSSADQGDEDECDFWLSLPRTFSYQSSRFELPLDINLLNSMTPLDYLSRYVSVSSSRRQLYNKVFVRHRSLKDGLLNDETVIKGMEEVLGSAMTADQRQQIWKQLGIVLKAHINTVFNYKQFCGIAAMTERLFCEQFSTAGSLSSESKSEIEVADFDRLHSKIEHLQLIPALRDLLLKIKDSGITRFEHNNASGHILTRKRSKFEFI